ncbi:Spermatogenesis-associated protein 7, partial [Colius striatus]
REEDLSCLAFMEDVTNEILSFGLFSNRVLEQLFECHIQENKYGLDESKMRRSLAMLRAELGCSTEHSHPLDLPGFETMEELEFTSKRQGQRKASKNEELFEIMD